MTLESLLSQLSYVNIGTQPLSVDNILEHVNELRDRNTIFKLMKVLEDNSKYDEVMFVLVHTVEEFDLDVY